MPTVFFIGATGYLGGAVLADLVKTYPDLKVTALVRNPAHFGAFEDIGVKVVNGSFSDTDIISSQAKIADITVNSGDSDDVGLTTAILAGQAARVAEGKPRAALLHTSGVAVFGDGSKEGKEDPNAKVWNDGNEDDIRSINDKMLHGAIDSQIMRAAEKGVIVSYIVCPGAIVGPSAGPVPTGSLFFRFIVEVMLPSNIAVYVGKGTNVFYMVRLDDLVKLFRLLFARILSGEDANASPYSRYYIAVKNPLTWEHIANVVGGTLERFGALKKGKGKAQSISASELPPPVDLFMAPSQKVRAERAAALGWEASEVVLEEWAEAGVQTALERLNWQK